MIALYILAAFLVLIVVLAIRSTKGKQMTMEQWSVGGRGFGALFVFLLLAGEFFTTFTFLGGSGMIYQSGAPAYYVMMYLTLAYVFSYYLLPPIWRYAKKHGIISISGFFAHKYDSSLLGMLVAIVGILGTVPNIVLQLKGLGIIVSQTSYGVISPVVAMWIGTIVVTFYVMLSGLHGTAWTAVIKDIAIISVVVFLGCYLPYHYYGGYQAMFETVAAVKPTQLVFPDKGQSVSWVISTVVLTVVAYYMQPGLFMSALSAKSPSVFRKNTIYLPIYTLLLLFVYFVGYTAVLKVPGLQGSEGDLALLTLSIQTFEPWVIGLIGGVGILTALVPTSVFLLTAGTLFAQDIYQPIFKPASTATVATVAKTAIPFIAFASLYFVITGGEALYMLLLMSYSLIMQLVPSMLCSLLPSNPVSKYGAGFGIAAGVATVAYMTIAKAGLGTWFPMLPQAIKDLNAGVVALTVNIVVLAAASLLTRSSRAEGQRAMV